MTLTLPPAQFQSLQRGESVRRVEKCDPQPDGVINGNPGQRKKFFISNMLIRTEWSAIPSPFPPAGTPVTVECETQGLSADVVREYFNNGVDGGPVKSETVECVWGASECKQVKEFDPTTIDELTLDPIEQDAWISRFEDEELNTYFFTATITPVADATQRKETE